MAARKYQDFDLSLEETVDGSYRARVMSCPVGGSAAVAFSVGLEAAQLEVLMMKLDPGRSGSRRTGLDPQRQAAEALGGVLFEAVFRDEVMLAWSRSQDVTRAAGEGLRLRLRVTEAPHLAGLPWELLFDRHTSSYVAQSDRTPVVRYLEVPHPPRPLSVGGSLRVLVVLASPTDLPDLDLEAEWRRVQEATATTVRTGAVVVDRLPSPTMAQLSVWLAHHEVHILHFVGHGDFDERVQSGVLFFCDPYGRSVPIGPETLGPFLHDHDPLRLVVLNSCRSARAEATDPFGGMAQGLVQQDVTAVVAMQFPISDGAAVAFTAAFYGAVSDGIPVDQATTEARKALLISHPGEWATPVLFMRAPDGRVFDDITAQQPTASEPPPTGEADTSGSPTAASASETASLAPTASKSIAAPLVTATQAKGRRRRWTRRRAVTVIAAAVVLVLGGILTARVVLSSRGLLAPGNPGEGSYTATAPWRLRVDGTVYSEGCTVTLTDVGTGTVSQVATNVYGIINVQMQATGSFRWQSTDRRCLITPLAGAGAAALPFTQEEDGDTDAFTTPTKGISAQVKDFHGHPRCVLRLFDATDGQELDLATATPAADTVTFDGNGRPTVYLYDDYCAIRVSAQP
jgi:hypothetical protein